MSLTRAALVCARVRGFALSEMKVSVLRGVQERIARLDREPQPAKTRAGLKRVRFPKSYGGSVVALGTDLVGAYAAGDSCALKPALAQRLIDAG